MQAPEIRSLARLARRTARRQWKRTALIVALVAFPVAAAQVAAGMIAAGKISPEERTAHELGQGDFSITTVMGDSDLDEWVAEQIAAASPEAETVRYRMAWLRITGPEGRGSGEVSDRSLDDPRLAGRVGLVEGRAPQASGEIAIGDSLATLIGARVGDVVSVEGHDMVVVGLTRDVLYRSSLSSVVSTGDMDVLAGGDTAWAVETRVVVMTPEAARVAAWIDQEWQARRLDYLPEPAVSPKPLALRDLSDDAYRRLTASEIEQLIALSPRLDLWELEERAFTMLNDRGGWTPSPEVWTMHPSEFAWYDDGLAAAPVTMGTAIAALLMLEVALVAGAAYATGARRRLRELGLMSVNGATVTHLRWAVVGEGLVAGVLGAGLGTAVGTVAMTAGRPVMQSFVDRLITSFPLDPLVMATTAIVGVVGVTLAAWVPARTAARVPATTALQGRMPLQVPARWVVPAGVGTAAFGAFLLAVARTAYGASGALQAGLAVAIMIAGFALLSGPMVAAMGRRADRFGVVTRLVIRDAARQRTRAATAVAAMMVVLAAPIVLAVSIRSEEARMSLYGLPGDTRHVFVTDEFRDTDAARGFESYVDELAAIIPGALRVGITRYDGRGHLSEVVPPRDEGLPFSESSVHMGLAAQTPKLLAALKVGTDPADVIVLGRTNRTVDVVIGTTTLGATEVPAAVVQWWFPRVLLSESAAADLGLLVADDAVLLVSPAPLTDRQRLEIGQVRIAVGLEWVPSLSADQVLLIGGGVALLVVLIISGMVTALSATESDHDLRAMVAVGAPPRMRRSFLGLQGGYYALFAAVLATPLALLFMKVAAGDGFSSAGPFGIIPAGFIVIPWLMVLAVAAGVPLVVGLVTALGVRSAPTMPPKRVG
ncbi:MAG: FtsX-like permease family protein [Acidimicrobiia bacterium]